MTDKRKEYMREYAKANRDRIKAYQRAYKLKHKEELARKQREYVNRTKEARNKYSNEYVYNRKKEDPLYKLKGTIRNRTYYAFQSKGYKKSTKTQEIVGAEWEVVKAHIESKFTEGMTWSNHGDWHVDHIIPLASANTEEELIKLSNYKNLQPLWAEDNLKKGDKI